MLNLGVIWDDVSYGPEAVAILFDMISRNLPEGTEGTFTCFTDFPDDLGPWVEKKPLDNPKDGALMFPMGCVVVRGLDALLSGGQLKTCFYDGSFPAEAAIVLFMGINPKDCDGWVKHVYKVGGGSAAELSFITNVSHDELRDNIRSAMARDCLWFEPQQAHDGTAMIVGGGPSLAGDLLTVRYLQARGGKIFALNNVPAYLARHGITPDFHVMLDAAPVCLDYVAPEIPMIRYYASQCCPQVLDLAGQSLVCWHAGSQILESIEGFTFRHIVGGGSTGATRAMILAYGLGYRKFELFGLDSSYEGDRGHAYEQHSYLKHIEVTCGDKVFHTSPQLLGQAEDFKVIAPDLIAAACEIKVHGSGLLRAVADQMAA